MSAVIDQEYQADYPIEALVPHPDNPRQHDEASIDESIEANGFSGALLVQKSTGHLLDGHGRVNSLKRLGVTSVPVFILDVDDTQAKKIMLARNRVGEKSGYNEALLTDLLEGLASADDLLGTGYTADDVDDLFTKFDENIETEPQDFHGNYAEPEAEKAERAERKTTIRHNIGLRELVCVFPEEQYGELMQGLAVVADFAATDGASATVLHAVVNYAKQLIADNE